MDDKAASGALRPLLSFRGTLRRNSFLEEGPPQAYVSFSLIFVFPLPSATTEAEEAQFRKEFLIHKKTYASIMDSMVIHKVARGHESFSVECGESLRSMRNATIEIFKTFFESMFGDDTECKLINFTSVDNKEFFMCLKLSDRLVEQFADMADYPLQLNLDSLEKLGIKISDLEGVVPAYVRFDAYQKENGLLRSYPKPEAPSESCVLRRVDRMRLIYDKLTNYIDLPELELMGLVSYYPCHNVTTLGKLRSSWGTLSNLKVLFSLSQPIEDVRNYLGEGVAFYFLFVQELARAMLLLMPVAAVVRASFRYFPKDSDAHDLAVVCYSVALMMWFTGFNKHWRRTEAYYANLWGMDSRPSHSEIHELMNPSFVGEVRPWPVDENVEVEEPYRSALLLGRTMSVLGQLLFTSLIVACVSYTQYIASVEDAKGNASAQKIAALAVSVQIQVFSHSWGVIAEMLTHQEQHVTMSAWYESKAKKTFVVGFFNTFFSFFYVGFFQRFVDPYASTNTNSFLQTNMEIVYGTYVMFGVVDIVKPYLQYQAKVFFAAHQLQKSGMSTPDGAAVSYIENQAKLSKYSGETLAADYMQVFFSLAFVVMFSAVMPFLTVVLAFITLVVQLRADAWKLLNTYRRAFPNMADGIGLWKKVMSALEIISICVNLLLLLIQFDAARFCTVFPGVGQDLSSKPVVTKVLIFVVALNLILACKACFNHLVPDEPERTSLERKRQDLQRARLSEKEEEFREGATMWAKGDWEASAFHKVPPLKPDDAFFVNMA